MPGGAGHSLASRIVHTGTQQATLPRCFGQWRLFGVKYDCRGEISLRLDEKWSADSLSCFREHVECFGLSLALVPLSMPSNRLSGWPTFQEWLASLLDWRLQAGVLTTGRFSKSFGEPRGR